MVKREIEAAESLQSELLVWYQVCSLCHNYEVMKRRHVLAHLGVSRRVSARLGASRRVSARLGASRRVSARLGASRRVSAHLGAGPRMSASMEMSAAKSKGMHVRARESLAVSTELEVEALCLPYSCPVCTRTLPTTHGLSVHRARWCRPSQPPASRRGQLADKAVKLSKRKTSTALLPPVTYGATIVCFVL